MIDCLTSIEYLNHIDKSLKTVTELNECITNYSRKFGHYHITVLKNKLVKVDFDEKKSSFEEICDLMKTIQESNAGIKENEELIKNIFSSFKEITNRFESKKRNFFIEFFYRKKIDRQVADAKSLIAKVLPQQLPVSSREEELCPSEYEQLLASIKNKEMLERRPCASYHFSKDWQKENTKTRNLFAFLSLHKLHEMNEANQKLETIIHCSPPRYYINIGPAPWQYKNCEHAFAFVLNSHKDEKSTYRDIAEVTEYSRLVYPSLLRKFKKLNNPKKFSEETTVDDDPIPGFDIYSKRRLEYCQKQISNDNNREIEELLDTRYTDSYPSKFYESLKRMDTQKTFEIFEKITNGIIESIEELNAYDVPIDSGLKDQFRAVYSGLQKQFENLKVSSREERRMYQKRYDYCLSKSHYALYLLGDETISWSADIYDNQREIDPAIKQCFDYVLERELIRYHIT